ncbi:MAG: 2-oxo-4-hydroxy-4-carboxy-5-ureidoimidazoline decarboxylase [Xenococcaceae cyanobacterium]
MQYNLDELNSMSQDDFTIVLGDIWEHTPEIATACWLARPFKDIDALYNSMVELVEGMSEAEKLALIKAHPDLGRKAKMAAVSVREQAEVGLDRLNIEKYNRLLSFNRAYKNKFGFPFVIAVKNRTLESILESFSERLNNCIEEEKKAALSEIMKIARFRLDALITKKTSTTKH